MLFLIPVTLMVATTLALIVLRLTRPQFRFTWLIALGATFLAWISVLLWRTQLPLSISFAPWAPASIVASSPLLGVDQFSWIYALSLLTLTMASLLTETVREGFPDSVTMAITVGVCGLGLLAVSAGNPLTLALIWAALDLTELVAMLSSAAGRVASQRAVTAFFVHGVAIILLVLAQVMSNSAADKALDFASLAPGSGLLLLAAAGLRLGVLPLHLPYVATSGRRRGIGTSIRLVSASAGLILLSRVATPAVPSVLGVLILVASAAAALYASWMWLRAPDELAGRPFWIIGLAGLSLFSAMRGNPAGAAAWGVALILAGAALFLSSVQHVWLNRLLYIGAWEVSALPFSVTSTGWNGQPSLAALGIPFFIVAHAILIAGFIRHASRPASRAPLQLQPAWTRSVYPAGIGLLLLMPLVLGVWGWDGALQIGAVLPGLLAALLAAALVWAVPRLPILNPVPAHWLGSSSAASRLERTSQALLGVYRWFAGISFTISEVLESEAGLMWTILFLVLFVIMIAQRTP